MYEKVGVGADLRAEQARAESDESAARAELDRLTNKVRTRAARSWNRPTAPTAPPARPLPPAPKPAQLLETRASTASEQLGRLRGEAERHAPDDGAAPHRPPRRAAAARRRTRPDPPAHGHRRTRRRPPAQAPPPAHAELLDAHRAAEDAAGGFDETAALLRDLLRDHTTEDGPSPRPLPRRPGGSPQAAAEARRSLRGCATDLSAAESAVREASDVLVRHANSTRYEQVRTPARQQIRELPAAALPEHAPKWADAFAPRLRVLTDELTQLERNRDSIVDRLRGLVESALATLRSAQRLSQLPEGLGEWSGRSSCASASRSPTRPPSPNASARSSTRPRLPSRRTPTCAATACPCSCAASPPPCSPRASPSRSSSPTPYSAPSASPSARWATSSPAASPTAAAIALYCTMAALRSNDRGRDRHRHAGTLFLDNPIGRANATYLLELQRAASDALGVQLPLHHRPLRHDRAGPIPPGHPAAQRRRPAGRD
ncbi:Chromosome segregation ATPase OS=Streptomyces tendae OX=1932 GN=GUR47_32500 PE=4 SV=1 [Streptomyces tendae]